MPLMLSCRVCEKSGRAAGQLASSGCDCGVVAAFRVFLSQKEQKSGPREIAWVLGKIIVATAMLHARLIGLLAPCMQPGRQTHSSAGAISSLAIAQQRRACTRLAALQA
jgi:hypothetical protein